MNFFEDFLSNPIYAQFSPEMKFMLACINGDKEKIKIAGCNVKNWDLFIELILFHKVFPFRL